MLGGLTHPSAAAFSLTFRLENILFCFSVYILSFKGSFHFRALVIVKHIKIMWDDRANIKWDPDSRWEEDTFFFSHFSATYFLKNLFSAVKVFGAMRTIPNPVIWC